MSVKKRLTRLETERNTNAAERKQIADISSAIAEYMKTGDKDVFERRCVNQPRSDHISPELRKTAKLVEIVFEAGDENEVRAAIQRFT